MLSEYSLKDQSKIVQGNLTSSTFQCARLNTTFETSRPKLKGIINISKTTSRETAFDSYKLRPERSVNAVCPREASSIMNVSQATPTETPRPGLANHSINFSKMSPRYKTQRPKDGGVRVLRLYEPNYDLVCKKTNCTIDFGKSPGRDSSARKRKLASIVKLPEAIKKLMLAKVSAKSNFKPYIAR